MSVLKKITKSKFAVNIISRIAYWYIKFVKYTTKWDLRGVETFYENLEKYGSEKALREHGLIRSEGKEYIVKDGDVCLFKINA